MRMLFKRIIVWAIRKGLNMYPDETIIPDKDFHLHKNPRRKAKTNALQLPD
jgi:hypothetical protein